MRILRIYSWWTFIKPLMMSSGHIIIIVKPANTILSSICDALWEPGKPTQLSSNLFPNMLELSDKSSNLRVRLVGHGSEHNQMHYYVWFIFITVALKKAKQNIVRKPACTEEAKIQRQWSPNPHRAREIWLANLNCVQPAYIIIVNDRS